MSTNQRKAPVPHFPAPSERYSPQNEAQFRVAVERAVQEAVGAFLQPHMVSDTFSVGDNDDYALGEFVTVVRVTVPGGGSTLTGIANGYDAREIRFINVSSNTLSLSDEDAGSEAANRLMLTGGVALNLAQDEMVDFQYDPITERWRETNTT